MTRGTRELADQHENCNKGEQRAAGSTKGIGAFREPLGELRDLEKIALVGVESRTSPCQSGMCLVVNVLPVLHDAFN